MIVESGNDDSEYSKSLIAKTTFALLVGEMFFSNPSTYTLLKSSTFCFEASTE
jgi:hypothetical protein